MAKKPSKEASDARAEYQRRYFSENRERILRRRREKRAADKAAGKVQRKSPSSQSPQALELKRLKCREYYAAHREQQKARAKKWREDNRERALATQRAYRKAHAAETKARFDADEEAKRRRYVYAANWKKRKSEADPSFAEYMRVLARMQRALKNHMAGRRVTAASKIVQLLGCEWLHFISHIESQFQPGMTWENHGRSGWHFDHIIPMSSFDLTDEQQLKKACHYTNVQPLWAADNIRKGGRVA